MMRIKISTSILSLTLLCFIILSSSAFATRLIVPFHCQGKVSLGEEKTEGNYDYWIYSIGAGPLKGMAVLTRIRDDEITDREIERATLVEVTELSSEELADDEDSEYILESFSLSLNEVEKTTVWKWRYDESDDGNEANFFKFQRTDGSIVKGGMIGWGLLITCNNVPQTKPPHPLSF